MPFRKYPNIINKSSGHKGSENDTTGIGDTVNLMHSGDDKCADIDDTADVVHSDDYCTSVFIGFPDDSNGESCWSSIYTIVDTDEGKFHRPIFIGNKIVVALLYKEVGGRKDIYPKDMVSVVYSWEKDEIVYLDIHGYKKTLRPGKGGTNGVTFTTLDGVGGKKFLSKDYEVVKQLVRECEF